MKFKMKSFWKYILTVFVGMILSLQAQDFLSDLPSEWEIPNKQTFTSDSVESGEPFKVSIVPLEEKEKRGAKISVQIAPDHYLYKEYFIVTASDKTVLTPVKALPEVRIKDPFTNEDKDVYNQSFEAEYLFPDNVPDGSIKVEYMGCNEEMCFMPQELVYEFSWLPKVKTEIEEIDVAAEGNRERDSVTEGWRELAELFIVKATASGSMGKDEFFSFLDQIYEENQESGVMGIFAKWGLMLTIPLIVFLGIGLNLTPCVLPMIPINLAIIGAGVKADNRSYGFFLGGIYGLGMAISYGCLGLAVVLAGATFGVLNSSPWFNFITAIIFILLSLAMFDVFNIDLSRFNTNRNVDSKNGIGKYLLIFGLGVFSALLAGACVAPVLIAVLLLSADLYSAGNYAGLTLPFFLGLGMALPWPIAGAGIGFLPKPGMWMTRVKQGFGILILFMAAYYGYTGYHLLQERGNVTELSQTGETVSTEMDMTKNMVLQLEEGLKQSIEEKKPVFIDFWATWCKSCMYMERTTFNEEEVKARLEKDFIVLKLQAENPKQSGVKEVLDYYQVMGLPTYLILSPLEEIKQ